MRHLCLWIEPVSFGPAFGEVILGFKDIYSERKLFPRPSQQPQLLTGACDIHRLPSTVFTLPPRSPVHPHPLISHQCCNPSSPSSLCVVQSWVIGPWIAPFPSLSISCLASDLSLLPTTSISKSGQPHPKRSMIHFSTPARINLIWRRNLRSGSCRRRPEH